MSSLVVNRVRDQGIDKETVLATVEKFRDRYDGEHASVEARSKDVSNLVIDYYDLVTDFYEYGWGVHFHFATRDKGESFHESLIRHENVLFARGRFKKGDHIIDFGCGVGGPLFNCVRFTHARVTGINSNAYQIRRCKRHCMSRGLQAYANFVHADFNKLPMADNSVDGGYAIEATCHAADLTKALTEILRVLKPGSRFLTYDWVITDKYDHSNEYHRSVRHQIELGNALPSLRTMPMITASAKEAGFIVVECVDIAAESDSMQMPGVPWWEPLDGNFRSLSGFRASRFGRWMTSQMLRCGEYMKIMPRGSYETTAVLEEGALGLVAGGKLGIFSPMILCCFQKPEA